MRVNLNTVGQLLDAGAYDLASLYVNLAPKLKENTDAPTVVSKPGHAVLVWMGLPPRRENPRMPFVEFCWHDDTETLSMRSFGSGMPLPLPCLGTSSYDILARMIEHVTKIPWTP